MNKKLPDCFTSMKPVMRAVAGRYETRNNYFHTSTIKHKFAECSLHYCLIEQLYSENCFTLSTDKVNMNSFYNFKVFIKNRIINSYKQ